MLIMRVPLNNPPKPSMLFGVPTNTAAFDRHAGIDYPVGTGTPVYAPVSGRMITLPNVAWHGNVVDILRDGKWYRMMHLSKFAKGDGPVAEGELIGYSGNTDGGTGNNTGSHLHWDIRVQQYPTSFAAFRDPLKELAASQQGGTSTVTDDEKLKSPPVLDVAWYRNRYPDLAQNGINTNSKARQHWLTAGIREGRESSKVFKVKQYKARYADLASLTNRAAALHWFNNGIREGRKGVS